MHSSLKLFLRPALAVALGCLPLSVHAEDAKGIKIGILSQLSGPVAAYAGMSSVEAVKMAIDDFGGSVLGMPVEVIWGDHQNKPDIGVTLAREWLDVDNVDVIADVNNSAVALGVNDLVRQKNKMALWGATANALVGEGCSINTSQWVPDTYTIANGVMNVAFDQGSKKFFFISVDYIYGKEVQELSEAVIRKRGGEVVGSAKHPFTITDFSPFLIEAQAKGADTLALPTFGSFIVNTIKQAHEFGLKMKIAPYYFSQTDVEAIGMENLQNVFGVTPFYWDRNEKVREFSDRFAKRFGRPPSWADAQQYSAVTHYLKAVKAAGTKDAAEVGKKMRELPIEDATGTTGRIREDGRVIRDLYAFRIKKPEESKGKWDHMEIVATVKGEDINFPLSESKCALVKK
ncbi:MAG: ABC transporter substrate-binding protein [Rhodobiaceae bacterium]|nr:ABC transporter substrate-binding protein [Rhodobiaceae bacterium]MCC0056633.1 ABC transporter substrate-binding protein [Rhodobiaceae bacterium]